MVGERWHRIKLRWIDLSPASWTLWASRLRRRGEFESGENDAADDDGGDDRDAGGDDDDRDGGGQVQPGRLDTTAKMCLPHLSSTASGAALISVLIVVIIMMTKIVTTMIRMIKVEMR